MHPINILTLNRRISFINVGKYRKEYRKAKEELQLGTVKGDFTASHL